MRTLRAHAGIGVAIAAGLTLALTGCSTADQTPVAAGPALAKPTTVTSTPQDSTPANSNTNASANSNASSTYLVECVDTNLLQHPRSFTLSCGDGNSALDSLSWSNWGATTATAAGTYVENNCTPSCAKGTLASYPVTVTASKLTGKSGRWFYQQLTVAFTHAVPAGSSKSEDYPLPD